MFFTNYFIRITTWGIIFSFSIISNAQSLFINEVVSKNDSSFLDANGKSPDWIELFNNTEDTVYLSGYSLSDDDDDDYWTFTDGFIAPNDFLVVLASGNDVENLETNFKLSSDGDIVILTNPTDELVDQIDIPELLTDISYGRDPIDQQTFNYFDNPTPGAPNVGNTITGFCNNEIQFSIQAGFYENNQTIELSGSPLIRFTTDGSTPNKNSTPYTQPINLTKTTVLKAACFESGFEPITIQTNTYFIGYNSNLPVWSISTHPGNFFDPDTGIYVLGPNIPPGEGPPYRSANFWKDWEREISLEFFEENGEKEIDVNCGVKIFGNWSRSNPKKSLTLFFREKYGTGRLNYPLFPNHPGITSFDDLLLRSGGNDAVFLHFRDAFHQTLFEELNFETQKYRPSVVFINGSYWGIHNIREKSNECYFLENNNIKDENIDLITRFYSPADSSFSISYQEFSDSVKNGLISYERINEFVDIESFIDYQVSEIYIANVDWPSNNNKYWRPNNPEGKWRWFMYDTDFSTGIYNRSTTAASFNSLHRCITPLTGERYINHNRAVIFLSNFMNFPEFKNQFINRYCDLLNTLFVPENVFEVLDEEVLDKIRPEIGANQAKWGGSQSSWENMVSTYKRFWSDRPAYARSHIKSTLNLDEQASISLEVYPKGSGYIKINTIEIEQGSEWNGIYFKGVPVEIEAKPNPGYSFIEWESDLTLSDYNDPLLSNLFLNEDQFFVANFAGEESEVFITISEINYNSSSEFNTQDWLELYNYGETSVNLSNWKLKDSRPFNEFVFPENTWLEPNTALVIVNDSNAFISNFGTSKPFIGELTFNLSNSGELVTLFNQKGEKVVELTYDDDENKGWPTYADGNGGTLELLEEDETNLSASTSWISECLNGSPGRFYNPECSNISGLLSDPELNQEVVFPNPSSDLLYLNKEVLTDAESFQILNISGQLVDKIIDNPTFISVVNYPNGVYILQITYQNKEKKSIRFIKN